MYKLTLTGTYRHRLRINLLFMVIEGKWKEEPIEWYTSLPSHDQAFTFRVPGMPIEVVARGNLERIGIAAKLHGATLYRQEIRLGALPYEVPIKSEPIKGAIIDATLRIEKL